MFDTIANNVQTGYYNRPRQTIQPVPSRADGVPQGAQAGGAPWGTADYFDQAKLQAALAAQQPGADGRTVLNNQSLLSALRPMSGMQLMKGGTYGQQGDNSEPMVIPDAYKGANGQSGSVIPAPPGQDPNAQYIQMPSMENPHGNGGKDRFSPIYKVDAQGNATPVNAGGEYSPNGWVNYGRDLATMAAMAAGTFAGAGALGALGDAGAGVSAVLPGEFGELGIGAGAGAGGTVTGASMGGANGMLLNPADYSWAGQGLSTIPEAASNVAWSALPEAGGLTAGQVAGGVTAAGGTTGATAGGYGGLEAAGTAGTGGGSTLGSIYDALGGTKGLVNMGGNLLSGYLANSAAGKAANAQVNAADKATALQKYMYDTTRADYKPYRDAGASAVGGASNLLANPGSIVNDPGYKFGLDQGTQAIGSNAGAKGSYYSGATLKALERYGQDYAGTKLNDSFNRFTSVAQLGATGTAGTAAAGSNYANQAGNNITGAGNALAGAGLYGANGWMSGINNSLANLNRSTYSDQPKG